MASNSTSHLAAIEKQTAYYVKKLAKIDRILERPVETLITQALRRTGKASEAPRFPSWLSDRPDPPADHSRPTQAVCFATLQRLWRVRHRYDSLHDNKLLTEAKDRVRDWFDSIPMPNFKAVAGVFGSRAFGNLNPLAASYIFRLLVEAGEAYAHSGFGFLAIFAMLWPLYRRYPDAVTAARIEPAE